MTLDRHERTELRQLGWNVHPKESNRPGSVRPNIVLTVGDDVTADDGILLDLGKYV